MVTRNLVVVCSIMVKTRCLAGVNKHYGQMVTKDLYQESSQLSSTHGCGDVKRSVTVLQKFIRLVDHKESKVLDYHMIIGILLTTVALAWQCDHESKIMRALVRWSHQESLQNVRKLRR